MLMVNSGQNKVKIKTFYTKRDIMSRRTRGFGRLKLVAAFLLVAVLLPKFLSINAATGLGSFAEGETGIKLCAVINGGSEEALRFYVYNDQDFEADVIVPKDTCKSIHTETATYFVTQYLAQEYTLDSVTGGIVSDDSIAFTATAAGQYPIIYTNTYAQKPYLHNFGYTGSNNGATAVEVSFNANGGTGSMAPQRFGLNSQLNLSANTFTREDYNFAGWNTKADGTGDSYSDAQPIAFATGGEITLYAQWTEIYRLAHVIRAQAQNLGDYQIDFSRAATISDDVETANGNGVNKYTENGKDVYYYRGEISNNNVIWGDKCWKIVRTTATGGVKLIYNGERSLDSNLEPINECTATGADTLITYGGNNAFAYNNDIYSPAVVGYMYGDAVLGNSMDAGSTIFTFANTVSREGNTYTLSGDMITGTWSDQRLNAANGHHYFCTDGASSCDGSKIGYINQFVFPSQIYQNDIYYLTLDGYDDVEDMKAAMFANTNDSIAKTTVENWFEDEGLDTLEDDLEDVVFCNDRSIDAGSLAGEDVDATTVTIFSANARNRQDYTPSLDCANKNDAFTKDDVAKGNGKLEHKVGLITADELTMAGFGSTGYNTSAYIYNGESSWTMSPSYYSNVLANVFLAGNSLDHGGSINGASAQTNGFRPMVSLKSTLHFANGGDGTATNPYVVVSE